MIISTSYTTTTNIKLMIPIDNIIIFFYTRILILTQRGDSQLILVTVGRGVEAITKSSQTIQFFSRSAIPWSLLGGREALEGGYLD